MYAIYFCKLYLLFILTLLVLACFFLLYMFSHFVNTDCIHLGIATTICSKQGTPFHKKQTKIQSEHKTVKKLYTKYTFRHSLHVASNYTYTIFIIFKWMRFKNSTWWILIRIEDKCSPFVSGWQGCVLIMTLKRNILIMTLKRNQLAV